MTASMNRRLRGSVVPLLACATLLGVHGVAYAARGGTPGTGDTSFDPGAGTGSNQCINANGVDLNQAYGFSEQIVTGGCRTVGAGEFYTRTIGWFTAPSWQSVPAGYVPSASTPMQDFLSKVTVMQVVDPGTPNQRTYLFPGGASFVLISLGAINPSLEPPSSSYPLAVSVGKLPPLQPGTHVVVSSLVMSALHCDGLNADPTDGCIGPGVVPFFETTFTVVAART